MVSQPPVAVALAGDRGELFGQEARAVVAAQLDPGVSRLRRPWRARPGLPAAARQKPRAVHPRLPREFEIPRPSGDQEKTGSDRRARSLPLPRLAIGAIVSTSTTWLNGSPSTGCSGVTRSSSWPATVSSRDGGGAALLAALDAACFVAALALSRRPGVRPQQPAYRARSSPGTPPRPTGSPSSRDAERVPAASGRFPGAVAPVPGAPRGADPRRRRGGGQLGALRLLGPPRKRPGPVIERFARRAERRSCPTITSSRSCAPRPARRRRQPARLPPRPAVPRGARRRPRPRGACPRHQRPEQGGGLGTSGSTTMWSSRART